MYLQRQMMYEKHEAFARCVPLPTPHTTDPQIFSAESRDHGDVSMYLWAGSVEFHQAPGWCAAKFQLNL